MVGLGLGVQLQPNLASMVGEEEDVSGNSEMLKADGASKMLKADGTSNMKKVS